MSGAKFGHVSGCEFEHLRGIDHAVILVHDLDRARDTFQRLGFCLTPRGFHSLGSQNHCLMFGRDYIELMAIAKPHPAFQYFSDFLSRGEGFGALALATDDAASAHAELVRAGIAAEAPLALSRPVEKIGDARFSLVQLPLELTPGFRTFVCQHHTPHIVWRSEYQAHDNGANAIDGVAVVAGNESAYRVLLGATSAHVYSPAAIKERLPGVRLQERAPPFAAVLFVAVADRVRTATALQRGGFSAVTLKDGSIAIGADQAHGVALVFV